LLATIDGRTDEKENGEWDRSKSENPQNDERTKLHKRHVKEDH
jgi:hypothetical protein